MLTELPEDVVVEVLCLLEVEDVLRVEQTCKSLRATVASRYLWLRLLQSLPFSHAPDLPPHVPILQLCSLDIRSIVIRAVKGYYNWHSLHGPTITRKRVINLPLGRDWECPREHNVSAKLLPGGKFILVHADCGRLGCWDIVEEKWIWRYRSQGVGAGGFVFGDMWCEFTEEDRGRTLAVTFCEGREGEIFVKLLKVDMTQEDTYETLTHRINLPSLIQGECRWTKANDKCVMLYTSDYIMLWRWADGASAIIRMSGNGYLDRVELAHGHFLVLRTTGDDDRTETRCCTLSAVLIEKSLQCGKNGEMIIAFEELPCESTLTFQIPEGYTFSSVDDMSVIIANWKPGRPTIISVVLSCVRRWHNALTAYNVSFDRSPREPHHKLRLLAQSEPCRMLPRRYNFIAHSRSGRMLIHTRGLLADDPDNVHVLAHSRERIWVWQQRKTWPVVPTRFRRGNMCMFNANDSSGFEFYSGAICCLYVHTFVVAYYD